MPSLTEVGTRLDRIDARIAALQSAAPGDGSGNGTNDQLLALQSAVTQAQSAADSANRAAQLGVIIGVVGIALALMATRRRGPAAG